MNKTHAIRNERIEHHLKLVDPIAGHYAKRSGLDRDDLKQVGRLGLLRAAEGYEQGQDKPFEVYAKAAYQRGNPSLPQRQCGTRQTP